MASILVIDDQAFCQEVCKDILEKEGHEVVAVAGGAQALKHAAARTFDLVLADIYLQKENGLDVSRKISRLQPDIPVIIMTSSPSLDIAILGIRQGIYDFLIKPLRPEMVSMASKRALEHRYLIEEKKMLIQKLMDSNHILKSFQQITLSTMSAQRTKTILDKALKGTIEVTGSSGGAILIRNAGLDLPFPYLHQTKPDIPGPPEDDFQLIYAHLADGEKQFIMPRRDGGGPAGLGFSGPLAAMAIDLGNAAIGGIVLWKNGGGEPYRTSDLSVTSSILRTLSYLLNTKIRQKGLHKTINGLSRRISRSSSQMNKVKQKLESLVSEVETEKTRSTKAIQRLEVINRIGRELGSFVDIEHHIRKVMDLCLDTLKAKIISLMLYDQDIQLLYIKYARGLSEEIIAKARVKPGEGISGWVFQKGQPLYIKDVEADAQFHKVSIDQYETKSLISAPVKSSGKVIGVLNVNNRIDGQSFTFQDLDLLVFVSHEVGVAMENTSLYEDIQNSYFETIRALIKVLEAKDETTKGHSERVTNYCLAIGKSMGLSPQHLEILRRAGILHDLGKVTIDLSILRKEGKLSDEEFQTIQKHPLVAAEIIKPMKYMEEVQRCIKQHHERQDGRGYPFGITDMSLEAKILAVADSYDAMTSWRPYRAPLPNDEAILELQRCAGTQFDAAVVEALVKLINSNALPPATEKSGF